MVRGIEWWASNVNLQFLEDVDVIGSIPPELFSSYTLAREHLFSSLRSSFHSRLRDLDGRAPGNFPVILHPVYTNFQRSSFDELITLHNEGDFRPQCRDLLPESEIPFIFQHGRVEGVRGLNPSFFNVVFLQSSAFPLMEFSYDQRVWFFQSLLAKFGSFKNLIVLCNESGIDRVYLSSLESGHPSFTPDQFDELARRLHVFGSAQPAQIDFELSPLTISSDIWANSAGVRELCALGQFAGKHDLLSPPVRIADLVRSDSLRRFIESLARYSQQAEGAMCVVDPRLSLALNTRNPIALVTASGRFGVVKTDLSPGDIIAIEIAVDSGCLRRIRVVESERNKPSVEAHEFLVPLVDLCRRYPLFVAGLEDGQGFIQVDPLHDHAVQVPPIRGIFHIHRRLVEGTSFFYQQDVCTNPPVGCGVDLMNKISAASFTEGVRRWDSEGRRTRRIIFEVANHGVNIVEFWALNSAGVYDDDCFADFQAAVSHRQLVFDRCIEQK